MNNELIEIRKALLFTQAEFSRQIQITQATYSRYENGANPSAKNADKIVKFCSRRGLKIEFKK
ncbi:helix-turn-helix domain-containing protein [bacterium]|nr:helix-turn-helix domain-containing protein [bacterium]